MDNCTHSHILSFVRRKGRITSAQQRALTTLWPKYGFELSNLPNFETLFPRPAPTHLEIGFGNGETVLNLAQLHPENNYLGIDVHPPGIGRLLSRIEEQQLTNLRILNGDAVTFLQQNLPNHSLTGIYLFFPDPWPKKRHHKRRLIQPAFIPLLTQALALDGHLYLATDWSTYAEQMLHLLDSTPELINQAGLGHFSPRFTKRPLTAFEQRGQRLGHAIWDLHYCRKRT